MLESLSHPIGQRLTLTLLHFLWQGVLVAVALQMVLMLFRVRAAQARYALSLMALIVIGSCPVMTFLLLDSDSSTATLADNADRASAPYDSGYPVAYAEPSSATNASVRAFETPPTTGPDSPRLVLSPALVRETQPYALAAWLVGVFVFGIRLTCGYGNALWMRSRRKALPIELARRIERLGRRLGLSAGARVFASERVREAAAVGFWRPIVLLPVAWLAELPPQALEAIIAHELAHIRRWDLWVNLYQRVLETLLFYHPAVWWVSRRVGLEREMCCDEMALAATGGRVEYANALNLAARLYKRSPQPALAASFMGEKKMNLLARVRNVLGSGIRRENGRWWPVGLVALILPLVIWAASASFLPSGTAPAMAGDDERGAREAERREGDESPEARARREGDREGRESPEARARREGDREGRESPEARARRDGDREGRESPEARARRDGDREGRESPEARSRREGDRDRGDSPEARSRRDGERGAASGFRPQTEREAALYRMITQLQKEVAQLRRELGEVRGGRGDHAEGYRRDGYRPARRDAPRDGDRRYSGGPRDVAPARSGRDPRTMQTNMFEKYDRNGDKKVVLQEFLAMREGTQNPEVRARWQKVFAQGDRNRDSSWSLEEFVAAAQAQRREGDARRTDAPRDGDRPAGRDAPRDGDRPETDAPRDGDRPRTDARRDSDAPARDRPRDGDKRDGDAPRD